MVRILTDSSCDLPKDVIAQLGVTVVPLYVTFEDGLMVRDGVEISGDAFYEKMLTCKELPTTSQPSPDAFLQHFYEAKQAGDTVVAVLLSAELSGTYQSARLAADLVGYDGIFLVDSQTLCLALGLLVQLAARYAAQGKSAAQIVTLLEVAKQHLHVYAVIDNLKYLRKGGRLPASAAIAGGLLGIKPIITIIEGKVALGGKARGLPAAYLALFKSIDAVGGICPAVGYYAAYTLQKRELTPIMRYFAQNLALPTPALARVGSVIGVHVGPGAFGFAFFDANLPKECYE